jgi:hypothetical protein
LCCRVDAFDLWLRKRLCKRYSRVHQRPDLNEKKKVKKEENEPISPLKPRSKPAHLEVRFVALCSTLESEVVETSELGRADVYSVALCVTHDDDPEHRLSRRWRVLEKRKRSAPAPSHTVVNLVDPPVSLVLLPRKTTLFLSLSVRASLLV